MPAHPPRATEDVSCNTALALAAANDGVIVVAQADEAAVSSLQIPKLFDAKNFVSLGIREE